MQKRKKNNRERDGMAVDVSRLLYRYTAIATQLPGMPHRQTLRCLAQLPRRLGLNHTNLNNLNNLGFSCLILTW